MKLTWLFFAVIFACLMLPGCKSADHEKITTQELPEITVTATQAQRILVSNPIEVIGTVHSMHRSEIAAKVTGTISELPVILGSFVNKGDLLVTISAGEIDAQVKKSEAQLKQAIRNLERERKLLKKNASTPESVRSYEDSLAIAEAAFDEAKTMQGYTHIRSPFNGRITRKDANRGDMATPGKVLLHIEDESQLQVITDIPEAMIHTLHLGDQLSISIPSVNVTTTGTIAELAPTANPTTRTGEVKLNIVMEENLRPGQFARVSLEQTGAETTVVPREAITVFGQMNQLYAVENGTARLRLVRTGTIYGDMIEILSGVSPADLIITAGHESVKDGQPVKFQ